MNCIEFLQCLKDGKKMRDRSWASTAYVYYDGSRLRWSNGSPHEMIVSDLHREVDAEEYKEPPKYMYFAEAFLELSRGKKIAKKTWNNAYLYMTHNAQGSALTMISCDRSYPYHANETDLNTEQDWYVVE